MIELQTASRYRCCSCCCCTKKVVPLVGLGRGDVGKNIIGTGMFWNSQFRPAVCLPVRVLRSHRGLQRLGPLHPAVLQLSVSREMRECLVFVEEEEENTRREDDVSGLQSACSHVACHSEAHEGAAVCCG